MTNSVEHEGAVARSRAYLLLGRLFLWGVTEDVLEHVRAVEPLAERLDAFGDSEGDGVDLDEAAAAHQDVFGFNVFPFQSTFLDETARAGGRETQRVTDAYRRAGFPIVETAESSDHVGVELNFLGFLSKMEAENDGPDAERAREMSRVFLDEHLLRWVPALAHAIEGHGAPFFAALAELSLETLLDHRRGLGPETSLELEENVAERDEEVDELLEDPKTGLRDIAGYLLVPDTVGIFLSRAAIRGLSRQGDLPAGFGARDDMMSNLLQSGAKYDGMEGLTERLIEYVARTRDAWRSYAHRFPPVTEPIAQRWVGRLDATERLLEEVREAAVSSSNGPG